MTMSLHVMFPLPNFHESAVPDSSKDRGHLSFLHGAQKCNQQRVSISIPTREQVQYSSHPTDRNKAAVADALGSLVARYYSSPSCFSRTASLNRSSSSESSLMRSVMALVKASCGVLSGVVWTRRMNLCSSGCGTL